MMSPAPSISQRMAQIEPFHVMEIQQRAFDLEAAGRSIIHMEIGQPDFGAPDAVIEQARALLGSARLGYTDSRGVPALRAAIAAHYRQEDALDIDPDRILITTGATGALMTLLGALTDPGDEYLMPDPCYPCNRHLVHLHGGIARLIPTTASDGFQLTADQVREHWSDRTRAVLIASPSNPTGTCIDPAELAAIHQVVRKRGGTLIVDEIYLGLSHGTRARSALALGDDVLVVNSFSKYFAMTGWRLGWLVAPHDAIRSLERLAQNATICPPTLSQLAACAAFDPAALAQCESRRREFTRRRDVLVPALRSLGFEVPAEPGGAFYVYADCKPLGRSASALADELLERAGVATTPGLDFGDAEPERYIRFAHTCSLTDIERAIERLASVLRA